MLEEWRNSNENKYLDSSLPSGENGELVIYFPFLRPMCYEENLEYKGFELDLLYKFARAKDYTINIISWLRITPNDKVNVNIGYQNITEKEGLYFSKPIYNGSSILAVRPDNIRSQLPITVLDGNYQQKKNNNFETEVEINGVTKTKVCSLPDTYYNDSILINCSISDISEDEIKNIKDMKNIKSNDRIKILYSSFRVDNFENASILFPNEDFSTQSDMDNIKTTTVDNYNQTYFYNKKSNKGLSTGGIIAIVIPSVIVLIGAVILGVVLGSPKPPMINPQIDNTSNTLSIKNVVDNPQVPNAH